MASAAPNRFAAKLWRAAKVFFGAWAFAVAAIIITGTLAHIAVGPAAAQWVFDHMHYATAVFFLVGFPIMLRWLK